MLQSEVKRFEKLEQQLNEIRESISSHDDSFVEFGNQLSEVRSSQKVIQNSQLSIIETLDSVSSNQENFRESLNGVLKVQSDILQILTQQTNNISRLIEICESMRDLIPRLSVSDNDA